MGNKFSRQEEYKARQRLVYENVRRVLFASLICCLLAIPVRLLINSRFTAIPELADIVKGFLICFEIFSVLAAAFSYLSLRMRDSQIATLVYRTFWVLFEIFSGVVIYADSIGGSRLSFYPVMLGVILLVPAMDIMEQMYYMVIQAVFVIFMLIKFNATAGDVFNVAVFNCVFFFISRMMYAQLKNRFILRERMKESKDGTNTDSLTGLSNRRGLEKRIYSALQNCIRSHKRISILMIDIDDLSKYNDSYGAERGDACIKLVSEVIRQTVLRNTDAICRLSGGRFLVFMEGGSDMEPVALGEKVRTNIEGKRIQQGRRAQNPFVTVSIGAASCVPRGESDFSAMYDEAENSMFEAKEHGKNITIYDEQIYGDYRRRAN